MRGGGFRRDGGGDEARPTECARQRRSARQTDKPAGVNLTFFLSLPRLTSSLCVCPSTLTLYLPISLLLTCHNARYTLRSQHTLPRHTHLHGPTPAGLNLATLISLGDTLSPAQPHRHTPLSCPVDWGCCLGGDSLLPLPPCPHPFPLLLFLGFRGVKIQRLRGPRPHSAGLEIFHPYTWCAHLC